MANRLQKGGAAAVRAVALVGSFEGLRQNAYPDPATNGQPWTICYGNTNGVRLAGCGAAEIVKVRINSWRKSITNQLLEASQLALS